MVDGDPLSALAYTGIRVVWVDALDGDVLLIEEHGIALADAGLTRADVASVLLTECGGPRLA